MNEQTHRDQEAEPRHTEQNVEELKPGENSEQGEQEEEKDVAEKPGSSKVSHEHADELADEWGKESFPGSDPPAHY